MKKAILAALILFCAVILFAQQNGVIMELSGTVELKPSGGTDFIPAKAGDTVARDTIVSTGFKSSALIKAGSTVLAVRPLTRLSFSQIMSSAGTETINVSLQAGRVRVDVSPPSGTRAAMTIQSPIATASVRGTSFEFDTQSLVVYEGTVAFQGSGNGYMLLGAGFSSAVNEYGRPGDPIESYAAALTPAPPAGNETGFINSGTSGISNPDGMFGVIFNLR